MRLIPFTSGGRRTGHVVAAMAACFSASTVAHATVLTFNNSGRINEAIEDVEPGYGDAEDGTKMPTSARQIGNGWTPNVAVDFPGLNGAGAPAWQWYDDVVEWDGAQMDGRPASDNFEIVFTPQPGYGVRVNSFEFDDYENYGAGHTFNWALLDSSSNVLAGATGVTVPADTTQGDNDHLLINTGMSFFHDGVLTLRITPQNWGEVPEGDRALDNLNFDQALIPEPAAVALLGIAAVGTFARRRRGNR